MTDEHRRSTDISPVEFGRVLGHLEGIRSELTDLKARTVWRLDDIEGRVESLERYRSVDERPRLADKLADKVVWGLLAAVGTAILSYITITIGN